ncbi:MAG TPA: GGDEF domain-containing protein [Allosphingosinicella sp.]|nr:GGDEF domain-containing protein [Allosphingosinicella sp.]
MTAQGGMIGGTPLSNESPVVAEAMARLAEENALLRASLSELRARLEEMEKASERDALTGLPNRPSFMRALERTVSRANRHGTPAALLYLDLDGLQAINARHGQIAGDAALIHVAKLLGDLVRTSDFAARVGGDEFAIILDHLDSDSAIETSDRIGRCIAENALDLGAGTLPIRATIGVATILRGDSVEDVVRRGELTMHKAKNR